jgi:hypothetical protein
VSCGLVPAAAKGIKPNREGKLHILGQGSDEVRG